MSDERLRFEYRIPRADGFFFAGGSVFAVVLALRMVASHPPNFGRGEGLLDLAFALLIAAAAVVMALYSLVVLMTSMRRPTCVELTENSLEVPELFSVGRITKMSVPLDHVTKIRVSRIGALESLVVWCGPRRTGISSRFFACPKEFAAMRAALIERAEARGVPIERRVFVPDRLQFSLRFLIMLTTLASALLGLLAYAGLLRWQFAAVATVWGIAGVGIVLFFLGPQSMRVFSAGVVLGMYVETLALIVIGPSGFLPATATSGTRLIYPFTFLLTGSPVNFNPSHMLLATSGGTLLSGFAFGGLAVAVAALMKRRGRTQK
ncbi:MAG: hypothetical protein GXX96_23650 [Planctomycetaceae bacterium]|nr:hypothetical protein [Planctomycetaceae bacterium]